ncbi:hypothetical protein D3C71_1770960 [compost metagenome]
MFFSLGLVDRSTTGLTVAVLNDFDNGWFSNRDHYIGRCARCTNEVDLILLDKREAIIEFLLSLCVIEDVFTKAFDGSFVFTDGRSLFRIFLDHIKRPFDPVAKICE